jgi:hypothetical protein
LIGRHDTVDATSRSWLLRPGRIDIPVTTEAVTMVAMASRAIADEAVTRERENEKYISQCKENCCFCCLSAGWSIVW